MHLATITISMPPTFEVGPLTLAWHGVMTAGGIVVGTLAARHDARQRGTDPEQVLMLAVVLSAVGMVGARIYYLLQVDPGSLVRPADWLANTGFAFYGALIFGLPAAAIYAWQNRLSISHLDSLAAGFPLGMAVGRLGDVINGEHYGPATNLPWGFRYTHPDAAVPSPDIAYQSGAAYEVLLALGMLAVLWPMRRRFRVPGTLLAATVALYAAGRFLIFFAIRDTDVVAFGLRQAQLTSLGLVAVAAVGGWWLWRRRIPTASKDGPTPNPIPDQSR